MNTEKLPYIFKCSVSEDLYGASPNPDGDPLPTPGGGKWLPVDGLDAIGAAAAGFDAAAAQKEIDRWGCHWFTSKGPRHIYWGPDGPPVEAAMPKKGVVAPSLESLCYGD